MNSTDKHILLEETGCLGHELLLRYRDNRLTDEERHAVERHLVDCPLCAEALEGLAFVSSPVVFDQLNENVRQLASSGSRVVNPRHYWMAAASVSVVVLLSAYLYTEYISVQHPVVVLQHEPGELPASQQENSVTEAQPAASANAPVTNNASQGTVAAVNSVSESANESVADVIAADAEPEIKVEQSISKAAADEETTQKDATVTQNETLSGFSSPTYSNQASYPRMVPPVTTDLEKSESKKSRSKSAAVKSDAFAEKPESGVTYIHNLKVIDYSIEDPYAGNATAPSNSVEPKFQNKETKETETAAETQVTRKITYLELLGNYITLFKNQQYQEAINGFNELLVIHPGDQNAMFYKGLALFNTERYNDAIASLSGPGNDSGSTFYDEARFHMGRSYAAIGNTTIAKDIFRKLVTENGFYAEQAKTELQKLP